MIKKPKISYNTIRNNKKLGGFMGNAEETTIEEKDVDT